MRTSKAFLSCAVVVAAGLLTAPAVTASHSSSGTNTPTPAPSPPPTSCSTGLFQIKVTSGPSFVSCTAADGQCTEIEYTVISGGTPDHVAVLEGVGVWSAEGEGIQWYKPGAGDPVTDLGERSYHEQAVKFNPTGSSLQFTIRLAGQRKPSPTSVATKKGSKVGACRILGIGLETAASPFQSTQKNETVNFKGCAVTFVRNSLTGEIVSAALDPEQSSLPACTVSDPPCCSELITSNIDKLSLTLEGFGDLGAGQIGDGYVSSGTGSCTTRVIGGRVYTWGSPCP